MDLTITTTPVLKRETKSPVARRRVRPGNLTLTGKRSSARGDLMRVARLCGRPDGVGPSQKEYFKHGVYSRPRVLKYAGKSTWSAALRVLGITPPADLVHVTRAKVRDDVCAVRAALRLGEMMPTAAEQRAHGTYGPTTVMAVLGAAGTWHLAARELGLKPQGVAKGDGAPVITRETVVFEYRRVAQRLGRVVGGVGPTRKEFRTHARFTDGVIDRRFGSFNDLVELAGFTPRAPLSCGRRRTGAAERKAA